MSKPPIQLDGVPTSEQVCQQLADEGRPVVLAFSRGKDSLCAWQTMVDHGIDVRPFHMHAPPGLKFIDDSLKTFEDHFQTRIRRYVHPGMYLRLQERGWQPPHRLDAFDRLPIAAISFEDVNAMAIDDEGLPDDTWVADGVRAADSSLRRLAFKRHGVIRHTNSGAHKASVVWDWRISHIRDCIRANKLPQAIDYEWFDRSWDGFDYRFLEPLSRHAPDDLKVILDWFPLADMELYRHDL